MCDTMVALPCCTGDGSLLFAKNSDREPNEPHVIVRVPGRRLKAGEKIECTYISVEDDRLAGLSTKDVILFKPVWIWGAEMGVNENGLVIGNEAVFTKEKVDDKALLGMDILRLALELCSGAREALDYIVFLTEKYGQGGKAGYTQNLKYHNSYLIADPGEAYVLETAGKHWAYRKVRDVYSISNALSIRGSFDGCSSRLVEHALDKGWCRSREEFDFKKSYESKLHAHFTKGDKRRKTTEEYMRNRIGSLCAADMMDILRSHGGREDVLGFRTGSMECVCMHAGGGLITSQTTGSFVVRLKEGEIGIWATGSSLPCISVFKPLWFSKASGEVFSAGEGGQSAEFWKYAEDKHRGILDGSITDIGTYLQERDRLEKELMTLAGKALTDEERIKVTDYAVISERKLLDKLEPVHESRYPGNKGGAFYRMYWKRQNRSLKDSK